MKTQYSNNNSHHIEINAPLDDVWQVLADFNNVYTWAPAVQHSYAINHKDQEVGAGRTCEIKGFGNLDEVITEWQDSSHFAFTISPAGPIKQAFSRWQLSKVSEQTTRLTVDFSYDLKWGMLGTLLNVLAVKSRFKSGLNDTLRSLKDRVETGKLQRPLVTAEANA